jgi:hypothetical protein
LFTAGTDLNSVLTDEIAWVKSHVNDVSPLSATALPVLLIGRTVWNFEVVKPEWTQKAPRVAKPINLERVAKLDLGDPVVKIDTPVSAGSSSS